MINFKKKGKEKTSHDHFFLHATESKRSSSLHPLLPREDAYYVPWSSHQLSALFPKISFPIIFLLDASNLNSTKTAMFLLLQCSISLNKTHNSHLAAFSIKTNPIPYIRAM